MRLVNLLGGFWFIFRLANFLKAVEGTDPQSLPETSPRYGNRALIRYMPNAGFLGTVTFTFKAWDETAGTAGQLSAPTGSAFSSAAGPAVLLVNTAPTLQA
jgi:hypothetical protein